jgi:ferredoxin
MKIVVDRDRCEANQRCMKIAPEVFQVDSKDILHILVERPSAEQRARVEKAVRACPRDALSLVDD